MPKKPTIKLPGKRHPGKDKGGEKKGQGQGQGKGQGKPPPPDEEDDSSVDSHGNIRNLVDYTEEEDSEEEEEYVDSEEDSGDSGEDVPMKPVKPVKKPVRPLRKAAIKSRQKTLEILTSEEENSDEEEDTDADADADADVDCDADDENENENEEDTIEETDNEEETEEADDTDNEEETESKKLKKQKTKLPIQIMFHSMGQEDEREAEPQKPKKYRMSKESEEVRSFVRLVQTSAPEEEDIDRDIGYFKSLSKAEQDRLLAKLQTKVNPVVPAVPLKFQIMAKEVPSEIERVALAKYQSLQTIDPSSSEYYKANQWIQGYTQLPLGIYRNLPVKLEDGPEPCKQFMGGVAKCLETAIFGHNEAKLQILQFVSNWIANPIAAGNVLSIYGPPGVGKTTLIKEGVAKALDRPFEFITLGGATDASYLDGHSYTYEGSTWGKIAATLMKAKCMNPIIYFDELDKVSDTPKGEEINNLLIHLTDGAQNDKFQDKYFTGIDLDLRRCLFIFSHNSHDKVNPILRDRMYNIQVQGFTLKEKLVIAEQYLLRQSLQEVGLWEKVGFPKELLTHIIQHFTGEEKGVRELKRAIQTIASKINLLRFYNDKDRVPFAVPGFTLPFTVTRAHIELFLKKPDDRDPSIAMMYQ